MELIKRAVLRLFQKIFYFSNKYMWIALLKQTLFRVSFTCVKEKGVTAGNG